MLCGNFENSALTLRPPQSGIDPREAAYIQAKTVTSLGDWTSYLENVGLEGLDISQFVPSAKDAVAGQNIPIISFAVSGGGQRYYNILLR